MLEQFKLTNKVAIITGGASGLGRAISEAFVEAGAKIVIADFDEKAGNATIVDLGTDNAIFQQTDVTKDSSVKACIDTCLEQFGRLDCLVNNVGGPGPVQDITEACTEDIVKTFEMNVVSAVLGIKYAIPALEQAGGGSIINLSSTNGSANNGKIFAYNIAKAALERLTLWCSYNLGPKNIRVNAIQPGTMKSPVVPRLFGVAEENVEQVMPAFTEFLKTMQPLNTAGVPEDIANMAVFLASDAARFVSGQINAVDGGMLQNYSNYTPDELFEGYAKVFQIPTDS